MIDFWYIFIHWYIMYRTLQASVVTGFIAAPWIFWTTDNITHCKLTNNVYISRINIFQMVKRLNVWLESAWPLLLSKAFFFSKNLLLKHFGSQNLARTFFRGLRVSSLSLSGRFCKSKIFPTRDFVFFHFCDFRKILELWELSGTVKHAYW